MTLIPGLNGIKPFFLCNLCLGKDKLECLSLVSLPGTFIVCKKDQTHNSKDSFIALLADIRLARKKMSWTNTLTYYAASVMHKCFITLIPRLSVTKRFSLPLILRLK